MHLYCRAPTLVHARYHCYEKIENALHNLYAFTSVHEYNVPSLDTTRLTKLQEKLERAALDIEKQERCTVQHSHLLREARSTNIAILRKQAITEAVLLRRLPAENGI